MSNVETRRGTFRAYKDFNFRKESLLTLERVNKVIAEFEEQGFSLTVRQIYYQLVQANVIKNHQNSYDNLSNLISNGRMAGLVSWTAIIDRGRNLLGNRHWKAPWHAVETALREYHIDKWSDQRFRPEVWVEKQALEDVVGQICAKLDVDFFAVKGYNSQSEQWNAAQRFANYIRNGQTPIVFHVGDHDPSGLDMTRDNRERLSLFVGQPIMVQRLALNMPQIEELNLVPNPAKHTDGRFAAYEEKYGTVSSWELDALNPVYLQKLIEDAVAKVREEDKWEAYLAVEVQDKRVLQDVAEQLGGRTEDEGDDDEEAR